MSAVILAAENYKKGILGVFFFKWKFAGKG